MMSQLETCPEWRVLKAVQPIFASANLPWNLVDPERNNIIQAEATNIKIDKIRGLFRAELGLLILSLPDHDISAQSFQFCVKGITDLLDFLDSLVLNEIVIASMATREEEVDHIAYPHSPPHSQTPLRSGYGYIWRWLGYPTKDHPPVSQELLSPMIPSTPKEKSIPAPNTRYEKLEALGRVVQSATPDSMVATCSKYLKFDHALKDFEDGTWKAIHLNKRFQGASETMNIMGSRKATMKVSRTRWESGIPWDILERLFRLLVMSTCSRHYVRLRLDGFRLDKCSIDSPPIDIFLSPCRSHDRWQDCRCTPTSRPSDLESFAANDLVALRDICGYITRSLGPQSARRFHVEFDDEGFLYQAHTQHYYNHARDPLRLSFEAMLNRGNFREPGGALDVNHKAVLALSLGRCLLHLAQGAWVQEQWTRNSVQFIRSMDDMCDVWHPYVTCLIAERTTNQEDPEEMVPLLLSFARLLVELATGETVQVDTSDAEFQYIIDDIQNQKMDGFGLNFYNDAVRGCFRVKGALRKAIGDGSYNNQDPRYSIRKIIYDNVVVNLEKNFAQISDRPMRAILQQLKEGNAGVRWKKPHATAVSTYEEFSAATSSGPASLGLARDNPTATTQDVSQLGSEMDPAKHAICNMIKGKPQERGGDFLSQGRINNPDAMLFDGGDSSVGNPQWLNQAESFFTSFKQFRERYLVSKVKNKSEQETWPRVRIAIIDTGVNEEDLRGHIARIVRLRKEQTYPDKDPHPIKSKRSFTRENATADDTCGHGTHVASILLKLAPDADFYIAKVSDTTSFDNPEGVAEAIRWAIDECNVDIINMSFGSTFRDAAIEQAISQASQRQPNGVLLFSAVSNSGRNEPRRYPASDANVIGVYALDGFGNNSGWQNPSADNRNDRFGTLGLGIKMSWNGKTVYKSGSSFATPTAVGMAANMLDWLYYMRQAGSLDAEEYRFLRRLEGIRLLLNLQGIESLDLRSIAPWHLFKPSLSDRDIIGVLKSHIPQFR